MTCTFSSSFLRAGVLAVCLMADDHQQHQPSTLQPNNPQKECFLFALPAEIPGESRELPWVTGTSHCGQGEGVSRMARWPLGPSQTMPKEIEGLLAGQGEGEQAEEKLPPLVFLMSPVKPLALHLNPGPSCLFLLYVDSLFWFFLRW